MQYRFTFKEILTDEVLTVTSEGNSRLEAYNKISSRKYQLEETLDERMQWDKLAVVEEDDDYYGNCLIKVEVLR
jgi:hypothetical protein